MINNFLVEKCVFINILNMGCLFLCDHYNIIIFIKKKYKNVCQYDSSIGTYNSIFIFGYYQFYRFHHHIIVWCFYDIKINSKSTGKYMVLTWWDVQVSCAREDRMAEIHWR